MSGYTEGQQLLLMQVAKECAKHPRMVRSIINAACSGGESALGEMQERLHKAQSMALFAYNAATSRRTRAEIKIADGWLREELKMLFPNAFDTHEDNA